MLDVTKNFGATTGGVRTYLLEKQRYVAARPWLRETLVFPSAEAALEEGNGVRTYALPGPPIPTQAPYRLLHSASAVRAIIGAECPDIIEIGSPFLVPWVVRRANRDAAIPLVWFYHGNVPRLVSQNPGGDGPLRGVAHRIAWAYVRRVSRLVRATLVASHFVLAELEREGIENAVYVPLGVDLDLFHPARRRRAAEVRRRSDLPSGPLAVFAGRFAREKHLDVIIRGWPDVEAATGARLVLIGDGPSAAYFRGLPGAERVLWLPFERDRERLADLLAAADLYIAPGPAETFGLAALEAMASGTPVLTVESGGVPEMVFAAGAGCAYPVGDTAAFSAAAINLFRSDLAALGQNARRYAEREHRWDRAFDRIFEVYRSVAAG